MPGYSQPASSSYIVAHWKGEWSLARSYWVNGFAITIIAGFAGQIFDASFTGQKSLAEFSVTAIYTLFIVAIYTWQIVGVWRSSGRYVEKGGPIFLSALARFVMIMTALQFIYFGLGVTEYGKISLGIDDLASGEVAVISDTEISLYGYINFNTGKQLEELIVNNPNITKIHLESLGGRGGPALVVARLVRKNGLTTYVPFECSSACTTIFVAGKRRILHEEAVLGFHEPSFPGTTRRELSEASQETKDFFAEGNVDRQFIDTAFSVPDYDVWYPTFTELWDAGVVTEVYDGETVQPIDQYCSLYICEE